MSLSPLYIVVHDFKQINYIFNIELSPACYDKERNRCQPVRHKASSKNSNDSHLYYASYASLQILAKVSRQVQSRVYRCCFSGSKQSHMEKTNIPLNS